MQQLTFSVVRFHLEWPIYFAYLPGRVPACVPTTRAVHRASTYVASRADLVFFFSPSPWRCMCGCVFTRVRGFPEPARSVRSHGPDEEEAARRTWVFVWVKCASRWQSMFPKRFEGSAMGNMRSTLTPSRRSHVHTAWPTLSCTSIWQTVRATCFFHIAAASRVHSTYPRCWYHLFNYLPFLADFLVVLVHCWTKIVNPMWWTAGQNGTMGEKVVSL